MDSPMTWSRTLIGVFVNVEMWIMFILNIVCMLCIYRGNLHRSKDTPVYLISGFNLLSETAQLLVHIVYVGPAILTGKWFFPGGQPSVGVTVTSTLFLGFWYFGSLVQIIMAVNRLCVVCFKRLTVFSPFRVYISVIFAFFFALLLVIYSQLMSPCCRITPDPRYFAYSYLVFENQTENPSMIYVDLPLDTLTSVICIVSYVTLFIYVLVMGRRHNVKMKKHELRVCVQFLIMFFTYTVTWVTFFVFPLLGITAPEAFVVTTIVFMANCGINSITYLAMNKEVRCQANRLFGHGPKTTPYLSQARTPKIARARGLTEPSDIVGVFALKTVLQSLRA